MPSGGSKRLDLNEALEDSPQTQALAANMESSIGPLRDFVTQLKDTCQTLHTQQIKVAETLSHFSKILTNADDKLFGEKDSFTFGALRQLGKHINELYSWQDMLCTQIDQAIVQQLDSFLSNDLSRVTSLKEAFHYARNDHETAVAKYNRVSKKKETERSRFDANSDLFSVRRRFHQSAVQYYAELNNLQYKKKFHLLDPMLAFMHSQLAYFKMGHEILTDEVGKFLTMLNVEIQKVRSEHEQLAKSQKATASNLEQQSAQICIPDPDPSDPFVEYQPANLQLQTKSGYLMYRQQGSKWERIYFYTKEHLLYWQHLNRAAEILLDLTTEGVDASSTDIDDRRYVFQIIAVQYNQQGQATRKALFFQAESAKSRDEWIATFINIVSAKRKQQEPSAVGNLLEFETRERTDSDVIRMERERVKTFVKSHSSSTLPKAPTIPQTSPTKQPIPPQRPPPLPSRPPPPKQRRGRPPPPPPPFGGGREQTQQSVHKLLELADEVEGAGGRGYNRTYTVRYLGSLEVEHNKGVRVVKETIRRIVAARALKNIMAAYYVNIGITHRGINLTEAKSGRVTHVFKMKDISYCSCHPDNNKLFGFIVRQWETGNYKFVCYVFESDKSGKEVYQSVIDAIKVAVNMIMGTGDTPRAPPPPPPISQDYYQEEPIEEDYEQMFPSSTQGSGLLYSPPPPPSPLSIGGGEEGGRGTGGRGMPKSRSTGSFRGKLESQLMNLPPSIINREEEEEEEEEGNEGFSSQQDSLIDFVSAQAPPTITTPTDDELLQLTHEQENPPTPNNSISSNLHQMQEQATPTLMDQAIPIIQDIQPNNDEATPLSNQSTPIYATVKKVHSEMTTPPPVPIYESMNDDPPPPPPVFMTTERQQLDDDFDALLKLEEATETAQNATQLK